MKKQDDFSDAVAYTKAELDDLGFNKEPSDIPYKFVYNIGDMRRVVENNLNPQIIKVYIGIDDHMSSTAELVWHKFVGFVKQNAIDPAYSFMNWQDDKSCAILLGSRGSKVSAEGCARFIYEDGTEVDVPFGNTYSIIRKEANHEKV